MRSHALAVALGLLGAVTASGARAEVEEVHLVRQYGLGYLPLTIMMREKLIERRAAEAGLANLKTKWSVLGNAVPINDGLLAGSIHFGAGGTAPMVTVWDKTRGAAGIRGVAAICSLPIWLVGRQPYKSVRDFKDTDRISMPGAGVSMQTLYLQMAVAGEFGIGEFKRLNPILVTLSHPDSLAALLSGGNITTSFMAPPFQEQAVAKGMHKILSSYDVMGGPATFISLWATARFRDENPKAFASVVSALREAMTIINKEPKRAAEIYVADVGGKEKADAVEKDLGNPDYRFSIGPQKVIKLTDFMHAAGVIKNKPASWKDLYFPDIHDVEGD